MRAYVGKVCGLSLAQISHLLRQHAETGAVEDRRARNIGRSFETVYMHGDVRLLATVDEAFGGMSALAPCEILRREFEVRGDILFKRHRSPLASPPIREHSVLRQCRQAVILPQTGREDQRPVTLASTSLVHAHFLIGH